MYHSRKGGKHNKGIIATIGVIWIAFDCELRLMKRGHLRYGNESHSCLFGTTDICTTPISVIKHLLYTDTVIIKQLRTKISHLNFILIMIILFPDFLDCFVVICVEFSVLFLALDTKTKFMAVYKCKNMLGLHDGRSRRY